MENINKLTLDYLAEKLAETEKELAYARASIDQLVKTCEMLIEIVEKSKIEKGILDILKKGIK